MADTAALVVALSAQLTKFERDMNEANNIARKGVTKINRSFEEINIGAGLEKSLAFLRGGVIGAAIGEAVRKIVDTLDKAGEIGEIAERIGITTDALQTLQITLEESGGKAEDATTALQRFSDGLGDASAGSTYLGKVLEANGVALLDQNKQFRSIDDLLVDYARLVTNAGSNQEKMMLVTEAFGRRAGPQMLAVLNQIASEGLPNMITAAKDSGAVLDEEMIKKADQFSDAWKRAARNVFVAFSEVVVNGIEIAKRALEGFLELIQEIADIELIPPKPEGTEEPLKVTVPGRTGKTVIPPKGAKDPIESQIDSIKRHIALMDADTEAVGQTAGAQERLRVEAQLTAAILAADKSPEAYAARIKEIGAAAEDAADRLAKRQFAFQEMISASRELGSALSEAFKGAILEGQKFDDVVKNLVKRLESRAFDKLFDLAFAPQGNNQNSLFGQLIQQIAGKASGGAVNKNQPYIVGEKGPELFVPKSAGMILPNKVAASGTAGDSRIVVEHDVINNFPAARVSTRDEDDGRGGRRTVTVIDEAMASAVQRPGSQFGRAMNGVYGARERGMRR